MKVIETTFRGCRFRSRLEARWAVFMHALKVPYVYEPEGYDLDDGICYAPDFWLPDQDCFLEIKPVEPSEEETVKAGKLAIFTKKMVMICFGPIEVPSDHGGGDSMHAIFPPFSREPFGWDSPYLWCHCPHCHRVGIQFDGYADRINCKCPKQTGDKGSNYESPRLVRAYEIARGFRFF